MRNFLRRNETALSIFCLERGRSRWELQRMIFVKLRSYRRLREVSDLSVFPILPFSKTAQDIDPLKSFEDVALLSAFVRFSVTGMSGHAIDSVLNIGYLIFGIKSVLARSPSSAFG